jgi:hypothetical protein
MLFREPLLAGHTYGVVLRSLLPLHISRMKDEYLGLIQQRKTTGIRQNQVSFL